VRFARRRGPLVFFAGRDAACGAEKTVATQPTPFSSTARRGLAAREAAIVTWLTVTGFIHVLVEGYVVHTPDFAADASGNLFAEICEFEFCVVVGGTFRVFLPARCCVHQES
jgi:hypothetical protein